MITINNVNITDLVDITSIVTNDTLDESLASASIVIPFHTQKAPYARFSEVSIDGLLYVVAEDSVRLIRKGQALYRHEISLIEPTKILQKRVIPNLTITQPQGSIAEYVYSIFKTQNTLSITNTQLTLPLIQQSASQDTAVIDGLTLKNTNPFEIFVNLEIENRQVFNSQDPLSSPDLDFEVELVIGSIVRTTKSYTIKGRTNSLQNPTRLTTAFKYTHTPESNEVISVRVRTKPQLLDPDDVAHLVNFTITPSQRIGGVDNNIYLDKVVDKLLQFHPEFSLSETTRTRIEQVKAPEFTFQGLTLYDALKEVANFVSAIVYLGEDNFTTIHFYFYDEVNTQALEFVDQEQTEYLDGFTDGFEINAANVIRDDDQLYAIYEPDAISWISVRANNDDRGIQIFDNQTAIPLQHGIYKPIQVRVKGLAFEMRDESNQVVNFPNTQVWDITEYVVESQRYNTFVSEESTNARGTGKRKSNTVFYTQGQPLIQGLGFTGTVPPAWNTNLTPNFAIVEAILNTAQDENPTYTFTSNYLIAPSIHDLQFRIRYIPYSEIRLTLYKDNNRGKNIMYYNEQARLNDMELLGRIAQENVNRSGNRVVRYEGLTFDNQLALGSKKDNEVLVNYTISRTPTINKFVAEYAVGYANLSNYVGVDSAYRQYEVPTDTIVSRRDKLTEFMVMTVSNTAPSVFVPEYLETQNNRFFDSLFGNFKNSPTGARPTYARVVIDNDKVVQSTIDAYRMGRTLGLAINMLDNYSAGTKKVETRLRDIPNDENFIIKTQEDARYTNDLGRFTEAEIEFYDGGGAISLAESSLYPDNDKLGIFKMFDYTYDVNKDAREQYGFIYEIVMQGSDNVIIYDGFVKYNRLAAELTPNIVEYRFLDKGYIPERNLDIKRTILGTGSLTVPSGERYAQVQANATIDGEYEGLIVTLNQEPIFAILTDDYDAGIQETKFLYPSLFAPNDYALSISETIDFAISATGFIFYVQNGLASATISSAFNATGNPQETQLRSVTATIDSAFNAVGNIFIQASDSAGVTIQSAFTAQGSPQETELGLISETITSQFNAVGNIFINEQGGINQTIQSAFNAVGNIFIDDNGTISTSVTAVFNAVGNAFISQSGSLTDTINGQLTATGQIATPYNLRGYATATAVNIVVDFDDSPAFSYTLQTFIQTIGTKPNGTQVTVTAPSSYVLGGATYTFVDWRVDETGQSSTNRIFTTTIDQQKTLRLRYVAFGFN